MAKLTLNNVGDLTNFTTAAAVINANSASIVTAMEDTLSRDGLTPNTMSASLDMNSNRILNLPVPGSINEPARLVDVVTNPTITIPTSFPTRAAFYAHKDQTAQTGMTHADYTRVTWPAKFFDIGSFFDNANGWWTPPAGWVTLHTEAYQTSNAASTGSPVFVVKLQRMHSGVTITNASPGVITWPLHGLVVRQPCQFLTSGVLPTGIVANTVYYVQSIPNANTFTISATPGGAAINTSSAGSGVHDGFCDIAAGLGMAQTGLAGFAISQATTSAAYSNGTDHFIVIYYATSSTSVNNNMLDANPAHTHFSGHWIGT